LRDVYKRLLMSPPHSQVLYSLSLTYFCIDYYLIIESLSISSSMCNNYPTFIFSFLFFLIFYTIFQTFFSNIITYSKLEKKPTLLTLNITFNLFYIVFDPTTVSSSQLWRVCLFFEYKFVYVFFFFF